MITKAVYCSKCGNEYHQLINPAVSTILVKPCDKCGGAGIMIVDPDTRVRGLPKIQVSKLPKPPTIPSRRAPVAKTTTRTHAQDFYNDALEGKLSAIETLQKIYVGEGYQLVGYHGCSSTSAKSIMLKGLDEDKCVVAARGAGFYIGSLAMGIPRSWSIKAAKKDGSKPAILSIYLKGFSALVYGRDYDWGMMDGDDDVKETGLEMVIYPRAYQYVKVVPGYGATPAIWKGCPVDSFSFKERSEIKPVIAKIVNALGISPAVAWEKMMKESWTTKELEIVEKLIS